MERGKPSTLYVVVETDEKEHLFLFTRGWMWQESVMHSFALYVVSEALTRCASAVECTLGTSVIHRASLPGV